MSAKHDIVVSIIMSVYNGEKYLDESINSILQQTYRSFEFIITDDCSSDRSLEIINRYTQKDKRIIVICNERNIGLANSLNNMIPMCRGKYIARMDADDIAFPDRLKKQVEVMESCESADICFSDTYLIDANSETICPSWRPRNIRNILRILKLVNYIPHPTVMMKASVLKEYGYENAYKNREDITLWIRLNKDGRKFIFIHEPLLYYRINPNSVRRNPLKSFCLPYENASACIVNKHKKAAVKYIRQTRGKQRFILYLKMLIPFYVLVLARIIRIRLIKIKNLCSISKKKH